MKIVIRQMASMKGLSETIFQAMSENKEFLSPVFFKKDPLSSLYRAFVDDDSDMSNFVGKVVSVDGKTTKVEIGEALDAVSLSPYDAKVVSADNTVKEITVELAGKAVVASSTGKSEMDTARDEILAQKVADGILTQQDADLIVAIFEDNMVDVRVQVPVLQKMRKWDIEILPPKHIYKNPTSGRKKSLMEEILKQYISSCPIIFKGDKSVGKNVMFETIGFVTHNPTYLMAVSRYIDADSYTGQYKLANDAAKTLTADLARSYNSYLATKDECLADEAAKYEVARARSAVVEMVVTDTAFTTWLKTGGLFMLNEWNMGDPNLTAMFLNPFGDNTGYIDAGPHGRLYIHPDCRLFACENENYSGAVDQNEATVSRFGAVVFPYPDTIKPQLKSVTERDFREGVLKEKYYNECDLLYKEFQKAVHNGHISNRALNIRGFERALKTIALFEGYGNLADELIIHIVNTCTDEKERQVLRASIEATISDRATI